ncbi:hypothetical protein DPMN_096254 [Dreissena polymorpha]|uniref:Uncharacterized protein n=1 Tax=Dreissena polymorpha TaxID=45954 RepID=A0A9D4LAS9_DREPO|nr:hypothetical protein DPMN_096254 [Dreissena polymorpha]
MRYGDKITQHFMEPAFDKYKASMAATSATDTGNVDIDMNVFLKLAAEGTMSVGVIMMVLSLFGILTGCYRHLRIMKVYFIGCVVLFVLEAVPALQELSNVLLVAFGSRGIHVDSASALLTNMLVIA